MSNTYIFAVVKSLTRLLRPIIRYIVVFNTQNMRQYRANNDLFDFIGILDGYFLDDDEDMALLYKNDPKCIFDETKNSFKVYFSGALFWKDNLIDRPVGFLNDPIGQSRLFFVSVDDKELSFSKIYTGNSPDYTFNYSFEKKSSDTLYTGEYKGFYNRGQCECKLYRQSWPFLKDGEIEILQEFSDKIKARN
jgi:hypothetical protein